MLKKIQGTRNNRDKWECSNRLDGRKYKIHYHHDERWVTGDHIFILKFTTLVIYSCYHYYENIEK
jgi:hypothetical protein